MKTFEGNDIRCILKWDAIVGESPLWHATQRRLYWVDIQRKRIHRLDPATGRNETFQLDEIVTCLAFRQAGGLICTLRKHVALFDPIAGALTKLFEVEANEPDNRFNDGRVDPQGRFWAGTMGDKAWNQPVGTLYRMTSGRSIEKVIDDVVCSNGTAWSPDGRTMYHTQSFRQEIHAYDFDGATGTPSNRRVFATVPPGDAKVFPDGLCVDAEGHVWSNHVGVGEVVRYAPGGEIVAKVKLPVPRAVGCTFGGDDLRTLFVTSARETMSAEQIAAAPLSGSVFAVDVGVSGLPVTPFAG